jgi:hypothetical protein
MRTSSPDAITEKSAGNKNYVSAGTNTLFMINDRQWDNKGATANESSKRDVAGSNEGLRKKGRMWNKSLETCGMLTFSV